MEAAPSNPIIQMTNVEIARAQAATKGPVLSNVNWTVKPGEYWVVGALPASGKTDLLITVAGLHKPVAGRHLLFGRDVMSLSEEELVQQRLRVGMVFEDG